MGGESFHRQSSCLAYPPPREYSYRPLLLPCSSAHLTSCLWMFHHNKLLYGRSAWEVPLGLGLMYNKFSCLMWEWYDYLTHYDTAPVWVGVMVYTGSFLCLQLKHLRELLGDCMFTVPLLSLPDSLQEEIIHWVFRNEDRWVSKWVSEWIRE